VSILEKKMVIEVTEKKVAFSGDNKGILRESRGLLR